MPKRRGPGLWAMIPPPHAHRNPFPLSHRRPLREHELARLGGVFRGQQLRGAPRARVQRHPQRGRPHRRVPALQVPGDGQGRGPSRRPHHHPRRAEDGGGPGGVHALVRRGRQGHRRRDGLAPGARTCSAGRRPSPACAGSARTRSGSRSRSRTSPTRPPPSPCRARRAARSSPACAEGDVAGLKYFRVMRSKIAGIPVDISRTGYTGDLGYEVWVEAEPGGGALGRAHGRGPSLRHHAHGHAGPGRGAHRGGPHPADVDYVGARKALIPSQKYSPYEIGLGRLVSLNKDPYIGQAALRPRGEGGPGPPARRPGRGLERRGAPLRRGGTRPPAPRDRLARVRSRLPRRAPGGEGDEQHLVAHLEEDDRARHRGQGRRPREGTKLQMELTVDHQRRQAGVTVVRLPFFDPPRKRA